MLVKVWLSSESEKESDSILSGGSWSSTDTLSVVAAATVWSRMLSHVSYWRVVFVNCFVIAYVFI